MLFTPKKYGRDWTRVLAITFYAMSLGFTLFAIFAPWTDCGDASDRIFEVLAFILGAIVCGALGRDQWKKASEMDADGVRNR